MSRNSSLILIFIPLFLLLSTLYSYAHQEIGPPIASVLLLYQERSFFADRRDTVSAIETLLGHYQVEVESFHVGSAKGVFFDDYDYVMVISLDQKIREDSLYERLAEYRGEILWLGLGVEGLLERGAYSLEFRGRAYDFLTVTYKKGGTSRERSFPVGVKREFCAVEVTSPDTKVYAWFTNGYEYFPFIAKDKNLYYVSRVDINEPLFYIFADVLNDLFLKKWYREDVFFLSIEDIHVFRDYKRLREMADYLSSESIPFLMGLIPYVRQEGSNHITKFTEITAFLETLRYMQARGGRVVLQMLPLTIRGGTFVVEELSLTAEEEKRALKEYITMAIGDCVKNGLYPIGASSPYIHLKEESFGVLKESFSSFFGMLSIEEDNYILFPFEVYDSPKFNRFYPYNIGYLEPNDSALFNIEDLYQKIEIVRGFMAGAYFHSYLPVESLYQLVGFLQKKGHPFYDILEEEHWIQTEEHELFFAAEGVEIIHRQEGASISFFYQVSRRVSLYVQWFLVFIIVFFFILFQRSSKAFKKSMIKG